MKRILFLFLVSLVSLNLSGGTIVKIAKKTGHWLTIDKGDRDGVKVGMTGKVQQIMIESGEFIPLTLGIFVVKRVTETSAELYIEKVAKNADIDKAFQVEFKEELEKEPTLNEQLSALKKKCARHIKDKKYKEAEQALNEASALKPDDEEIKSLLEIIGLLNAPKMNYRDYLDYKIKNPGSPFLEDLKEKTYQLNPNLPPEKYLNEAIDITMNTKGYYELKLKNDHTMIYIPGPKLLVDKYEVSNYQYLRYAIQQNIQVEIIHFSTGKLKNNYPYCCEDYPALVTYEQAEEYCKAKGLRLPTVWEWEEIAGKDQGLKYSWGNEEVDENGKYRANFESLDDGYIEVAPVDSYKQFSSPYGVVNLSGNVWEWVRGHLCKGGNFLSEEDELTITNNSKCTTKVGFRCIKEVEK